MKKILYSFMMLFIGLSLAACGDDDDDPVGPNTEPGTDVEISVKEKKMLGLVAEGYETTISFDATENWRAKSNVDWITASPAQGTKGSAQVTVKIAENTTKEERSGELVLETVSNSQTFYKVYVTQKGREVVDNPDENNEAPDGMKRNAAALVREIKVGWNLGNTCESGIWDGYNKDVDLEGETAWGNPKTTYEMIAALKGAGFNAIRIPCRWYIHADADMNIREAWIKRVAEIVDYARKQDMFVILNSHHDNWYDRLPVGYNETEILNKFEKMWTQIANAFKDYDELLIFAGTNEIIKLNASGGEDWGSPSTSDIAMNNKLNQKFVDAVRATGGNNKWRCLMVQPWACSPTNALNTAYKLPTDVVENRLIQEFHCYDPYNYCIGKDQKGNQWAQHEYSQGDLDAVSKMLQKMSQKFVEAGVPCIMAEFGSTQDNNYSKGNDAADKLRAEYHEFIVSEAKRYNIPGFYWDNGAFAGDGENFGILDRKTCSFPARAKIALDGIMRGANK